MRRLMKAKTLGGKMQRERRIPGPILMLAVANLIFIISLGVLVGQLLTDKPAATSCEHTDCWDH